MATATAKTDVIGITLELSRDEAVALTRALAPLVGPATNVEMVLHRALGTSPIDTVDSVELQRPAGSRFYHVVDVTKPPVSSSVYVHPAYDDYALGYD